MADSGIIVGQGGLATPSSDVLTIRVSATDENLSMTGQKTETILGGALSNVTSQKINIDKEKKSSKGLNIRRRIIGNYHVGKSIGEGTFGKVKMGTHTLTGEKVAIKILEKERITDVSDVERVAREIHILKLIRHPNIIQLYEIIETPKQLYLIMEYASGGELFDYIVKHTRLKEKEACKFYQ